MFVLWQHTHTKERVIHQLHGDVWYNVYLDGRIPYREYYCKKDDPAFWNTYNDIWEYTKYDTFEDLLADNFAHMM